jgi:hypothetical protein
MRGMGGARSRWDDLGHGICQSGVYHGVCRA